MLMRYDLSMAEHAHLACLQELCKAASGGDLVEILACWPVDLLDLLARRVVILRPAAVLEDFECLFYGEEIQARFQVDFRGLRFGEIAEFAQIRHSLEAFRLVALHGVPHVSRISCIEPPTRGVEYTRFICPVFKDDAVSLVIGMMAFHDTL